MNAEVVGPVLPISWAKEELGEVAQTQLGKMLNSSKQTGKAKMPYLRNINLQWGGISLTDVKEMDIFDDEREQFTLSRGDVLVCEGGEPGRSAVWNHDIPMAFQNAIHRIRPSSRINSEFLCYQFEWMVKNGFLDENFTGVTIKHFSQQKLRKIRCIVPPLDEQLKIVEILEEQLSRVDAALTSVRAAREKAARLRRSLLHAAFTGALTGHGMSNETLPERWHVSPLGDVLSLKSGFAYKSQDWVEEGVAVIKIANVRNGKVILDGCSFVTQEIADETADFEVLDGNLLMTLTGEIGAIGIYKERRPARLNQRVARLDLKQEFERSHRYLCFFLESPLARDLMWSKAQGMAQPNISPKEILRIPFPFPPLDEQLKICEILEEQFSRLDASLAVAEAIQKKASALRRSLLHSAFTGELTKEWREGSRV